MEGGIGVLPGAEHEDRGAELIEAVKGGVFTDGGGFEVVFDELACVGAMDGNGVSGVVAAQDVREAPEGVGDFADA